MGRVETWARVRAGRERGLGHTMGWAIPWAGPYPGLGHTLGWAIPWAGHREAQGGGATRAGGGDGREWVAATCWAAQVERGDQGKVDKGDTVQVPRVPWRHPRAREAKSCPYLFMARRAVAKTVFARGEQGLECGGREGGGQGDRGRLRGDKRRLVLVRRRALVSLLGFRISSAPPAALCGSGGGAGAAGCGARAVSWSFKLSV